MAFKTLVFMVIFKFASSMPDPNVNVNVNVNVEDKNGCNGCDRGCLFGFKTYEVGCTIEDVCMVLQCMKGGNWKYLGKVRQECGNCTIWGDPHFYMFDNHTTNGNSYTYGYDGVYTISQNGLGNTSQTQYGVYSEFVSCFGDDLSCVKGVTYCEPGIKVTMTIPEPNPNCTGVNDPDCAITVHVNTVKSIISSSVESFYATDGTVLVFRHAHVVSSDRNLNCVNVVGSQGLSVSFCSHQSDYAFFYVFPMRSLRSDPSQLYGLCGTYTGVDQEGYTERDATITTDTDAFADSWVIPNTRSIGVVKRAASVNRCVNTRVLSVFTNICKEITKEACAVMSPPRCLSTIAACIYDLCRAPNYESYGAGYATHMAVHTHLATSSCCSRPGCIFNPFCKCCPHGSELLFEDTGCDCHLIYGQGCIIKPGHHADDNKACSCTNTVFRCRGDQVDDCADKTKSSCLSPGDGYCSCRQGSGNCGGYTLPHPDCGF